MLCVANHLTAGCIWRYILSVPSSTLPGATALTVGGSSSSNNGSGASNQSILSSAGSASERPASGVSATSPRITAAAAAAAGGGSTSSGCEPSSSSSLSYASPEEAEAAAQIEARRAARAAAIAAWDEGLRQGVAERSKLVVQVSRVALCGWHRGLHCVYRDQFDMFFLHDKQWHGQRNCIPPYVWVLVLICCLLQPYSL